MASANTAGSGFKEQEYDYFLVLDFEATCDNKTKVKPQVSTIYTVMS